MGPRGAVGDRTEGEVVGAGVGGGGVAVGVLGGDRQVVGGACRGGCSRGGEAETRRAGGTDRDRQARAVGDRAIADGERDGAGLDQGHDAVFGARDGGDAAGEADRGGGAKVDSAAGGAGDCRVSPRGAVGDRTEGEVVGAGVGGGGVAVGVLGRDRQVVGGAGGGGCGLG